MLRCPRALPLVVRVFLCCKANPRARRGEEEWCARLLRKAGFRRRVGVSPCDLEEEWLTGRSIFSTANFGLIAVDRIRDPVRGVPARNARILRMSRSSEKHRLRCWRFSDNPTEPGNCE